MSEESAWALLLPSLSLPLSVHRLIFLFNVLKFLASNGGGRMDTLSASSLWGYYQETLEELKNKLCTAICELEKVKTNARDEIRRKEESINQLLHLLKSANQERDAAKDQLHLLLYNLTQPNSVEPFPSPPFLQPQSPQLRQTLASSTISDSENLTDGHNNQSPVSSPTSISPDLSIVNFADSCNALISQHDEVMEVLFDRFAKKPLPAKGRLLKAVIDAGPILDTLFVAGSLPRWRNPPPLKPLLVPPLSIKSDDALHNCSTGMAYYGVNGGLCKTKRPLMEHCAGSQQCLAVKRQKSQ